jgi:hypothetical protein
MKLYRLIPFIVFSAVLSARASLVSYVGVRIATVEKHAENVNNCSEGSQNLLILGLKNASGTTSYVWISTANPQYKDLESIALTALAAGTTVTVQADNDGSYQICSITGGKLRFISVAGN